MIVEAVEAAAGRPAEAPSRARTPYRLPGQPAAVLRREGPRGRASRRVLRPCRRAAVGDPRGPYADVLDDEFLGGACGGTSARGRPRDTTPRTSSRRRS